MDSTPRSDEQQNVDPPPNIASMSRRPDPIRVLNAQIAGATQRLADLDLLIPRDQATKTQRAETQQRLATLQTQLDALTTK